MGWKDELKTIGFLISYVAFFLGIGLIGYLLSLLPPKEIPPDEEYYEEYTPGEEFPWR